jgi:heat shock protein HslJ
MLKRNNILVPFAIVVLLLLTAGCGPINIVPDTGPEATPEEAPSLTGTEWVLVWINNREPVQGAEVTLSFDETTAGGIAACNSYGGDYTTGPAGSISFGEIVQTLMLCTEPDGIMELEEEYIDTLNLAESYRIINDRLEIQDQAGSVILEFERQ